MNTREFVHMMMQENRFDIAKRILYTDTHPQAVYSIAQEAGLTDSFDLFMTEMQAMYAEMSDELTEEELEQIAGGASVPYIGSVGVAIVCAVNSDIVRG